jgi:hypothetical protein
LQRVSRLGRRAQPSGIGDPSLGCAPRNGALLGHEEDAPTKKLQNGESFILYTQHVCVLSGTLSTHPFLERFRWLSMQQLGELQFPRLDGMVIWLAETQLSVSG